MQHDMTKRLEELIFQAVKENKCLVGELAEHLIANGVIVLPCKIGDSLYLVDLEYGVCKCIVNDIQILSDNEPVFTLYYYSQNGYEPAELEWDVDVEMDCFGKTVFLTKEEAETRLRELRNETT